MRNLLVTLSVLMLWGGSALADFSPTEARRIYGASSQKALPSFSEGDYVFLAVKWSAASDDEEYGEEIAEMSAIESALCDYLHDGKKLSEKDRFEYKVPEVKSTVVLDETNKNPRRKVFAFESGPLRAEHERLNPKKDQDADEDAPFWVRLLLFWEYN